MGCEVNGGGTLAAHFNKFVCFYYWEELDMHTYTPTYLMNLILEILYGTEKKNKLAPISEGI